MVHSTPLKTENNVTDDLEAALAAPGTQVIGKRYEYHASVASTNTLAREHAEAGAPDGLVIVADEQTAGRGRSGRRWVSQPGHSLMLSLVLRPPLPPAERFVLTMLAGVALCEAVEQTAGCRALLKWPNDLLLGAEAGIARKAAGVLAESGRDWVVIGMGLNVAAQPHEVVDGHDLAVRATSVSAAAGRAIERGVLLRALVQHFEAWYLALPNNQAAIFAAWHAHLHTLGQPVTVRLHHSSVSGLAEAVDQHGALLVRDAAGVLHTITAGDVQA
jgi:BirA family biotin operon repressor/biotin-[acetyl-CoA-carboxylase] ligase